MRKYFLLLFCFLSMTQLFAQKVQTGIEVLKSQNFRILEGKRIGLVTNPTGVDNNLRSDIDILAGAPNVKLVALFGPEHGLRGSAHAGSSVGNDSDAITHLPVYSLFGKNRMPSPDMLKGIDVLVYDIQDIGCRSFTYISTLDNILKAAAKSHIKVIVLDRPDPLGGKKIEGNIVEDDCLSFVSQLRVPYVYGMTPGELALFLNGQRTPDERCDLTVIKMKKWKRRMTYKDTGLHWVPASPHIPTAETAPYYAVSGIVGELDNFSIGVGYTLPFQLFGASWINAHDFANDMNGLHLTGVLFRPIYYTPFYGPGQGKELQGVQVYFTDYEKANLCEIQFYVIQELHKLYPDHDILANGAKDRLDMIDKICGSKQIRQLLLKRHLWADAEPYWNKDVKAFRDIAKRYYLYK
ncbi:MAG: DUF1343 domain-containing protein [Prevotella sp.]|nr:DUF1343 domain-containing protein [Prevotella sp.]MCH3995308.1 DUF1343 domain-containing protein [Prevotella sp.]MCI1246651.1 DUF1343 domain-containing protein [Prevotella sp.]